MEKTVYEDCVRLYGRHNMTEQMQLLLNALRGRQFKKGNGTEVRGNMPRTIAPRYFKIDGQPVAFDGTPDLNWNDTVGSEGVISDIADQGCTAIKAFLTAKMARGLADFFVKNYRQIKLLADSCLVYALKKFEFAQAITSSDPDGIEGYELDGDGMPKAYPYFGKQNSGNAVDPEFDDHGKLIPHYYYFDTASETFQPCAHIGYSADDRYATKAVRKPDEEVEPPIVLLNSEHTLDDLDEKFLYRVTGGSGTDEDPYTYESIGFSRGGNTVLSGRTTATVDRPFYYKVVKTSQTSLDGLYMDKTNEVMELERKVINVFLINYRTILQDQGRLYPEYKPIPSGAPYTFQMLVDATNAIVDCFNLYFDETERLPDEGVTNRMVKLKLNELIDIVHTEDYRLVGVARGASDPNSWPSRFLRELRDKYFCSWLTLVLLNADTTGIEFGSSYHGRLFNYNTEVLGKLPCLNGSTVIYEETSYSKALLDEIYENLKFDDFGNLGGIFEQGRIVNPDSEESTRVFPLVMAEQDELTRKCIPMEYIIDVEHLAEVWRDLDYQGTMYILNKMYKVLTEKDIYDEGPWTEQLLWRVGLPESDRDDLDRVAWAIFAGDDHNPDYIRLINDLYPKLKKYGAAMSDIAVKTCGLESASVPTRAV